VTVLIAGNLPVLGARRRDSVLNPAPLWQDSEFYGVGSFERARDASPLALVILLDAASPTAAASLMKWIQVSSSGSRPEDFDRTGGARDAEDRQINSLRLRVQEGVVRITRQQQGVAPAAIAV